MLHRIAADEDELAVSIDRCRFHHAEPSIAPAQEARTAPPGEHEGLERPGDERDERKREQEGGDTKNDAVGVRRRGHFRVLNVSGRRLAAKACLPAPNKPLTKVPI